jgi:hypothetical protein
MPGSENSTAAGQQNKINFSRISTIGYAPNFYCYKSTPLESTELFNGVCQNLKFKNYHRT